MKLKSLSLIATASALVLGVYGFVPETSAANVEVTTADELAGAVQASGTVKLGADIVADVIITGADKNITIDLNGHQLKGAESATATIENHSANVTITDSVGGGEVVGVGSYYTLLNHGTMTVKGGKIYSLAEITCGTYATDNKSTVDNKNSYCRTIEDFRGPSLVANGWDMTNSSNVTNYDVKEADAPEYATLNIQGGELSGYTSKGKINETVVSGVTNQYLATYYGGLNTIKNDENSILNISGGKITSTANDIDGLKTSAATTSGVMNGSKGRNVAILNGGKQLNISGGYIDGKVTAQMLGADKVKDLSITGGTIDGAVDATKVYFEDVTWGKVELSGENTSIRSLSFGNAGQVACESMVVKNIVFDASPSIYGGCAAEFENATMKSVYLGFAGNAITVKDSTFTGTMSVSGNTTVNVENSTIGAVATSSGTDNVVNLGNGAKVDKVTAGYTASYPGKIVMKAGSEVGDIVMKNAGIMLIEAGHLKGGVTIDKNAKAYTLEVIEGVFDQEPTEILQSATAAGHNDDDSYQIVPLGEGSDKYIVKKLNENDEAEKVKTEEAKAGEHEILFDEPFETDAEVELVVEPVGIPENLGEVEDLKGLFEVKLVYADDPETEVPVKDTKIALNLALPEELLGYDNYKAVYFAEDENGELVAQEEFEAKLTDEKLTFKTTHLSLYGVLAYNNPEESEEEGGATVDPTTDEETGEAEETTTTEEATNEVEIVTTESETEAESGETAASPDTGRMLAAGGAAVSSMVGAGVSAVMMLAYVGVRASWRRKRARALKA